MVGNRVAWATGASFLLILATVGEAYGQAKPSETSSPSEKVEFSALLDGYYSSNTNDPGKSANGGRNDLYNFDDKANMPSLSMVELGARYQRRPIGLDIDLLFGRANSLIHGASSGSTANYLKQAYISIAPGWPPGAQLDAGQFATSAGAEVIEAKDDWNYSRSLLFSWAIPYFHFGFRSSVPVSRSWTAGLQLVNGWNNAFRNNGGVTWGLTSEYSRPGLTWSVNHYTGPLMQGKQRSYRNLVDTTLLIAPGKRLQAYVNYDYGQNRAQPDVQPGGTGLLPVQSAHWQGVALAARGQIHGRSALAVRCEYFDDDRGYATGAAQALKELTATYEYGWLRNLMWRLEYRRDWSNVNFFHRGASGLAPAQSTATAALIAYFGRSQ